MIIKKKIGVVKIVLNYYRGLGMKNRNVIKMKVKCIGNERCESWLTIGKIYNVFIIEIRDYWVIDDSKTVGMFNKKYFKSLSEIIKERNDKIDKLLN